jgi:hypothetical protein
MQGLRVAVESPLLAKAILSTPKGNTNNITTPDEPPELQVVLNDVDQDAVDLATMNANTANIEDMTVTKRVAQALLHEESFEVCVLDPFGSPTPFLDAAVARVPHLGLLEICATDVGALYGSRPAVTRRHLSAGNSMADSVRVARTPPWACFSLNSNKLFSSSS